MTRQRLPDRRPGLCFEFEHDGFVYHGTIGLRATGEPAEIFLSAGKTGTAIESVARDAAIIASLALQHGVTVDDLRHSLTRLEGNEPAGPVCKLLDLLAGDSQ